MAIDVVPITIVLSEDVIDVITTGLRSLDTHLTLYLFILFRFNRSVGTWIYLVALEACESLNNINILLGIFLLILHTLLYNFGLLVECRILCMLKTLARFGA